MLMKAPNSSRKESLLRCVESIVLQQQTYSFPPLLLLRVVIAWNCVLGALYIQGVGLASLALLLV